MSADLLHPAQLIAPTPLLFGMTPATSLELMSRSSSSSTLVDANAPLTLEKDQGLRNTPLDIDTKVCEDCADDYTVPTIITSEMKIPDEPVVLKVATMTNPIKDLIQSHLAKLDRPLRIVGLLATPDSGCRTYARMTDRTCGQSGVEFLQVDLLKKVNVEGSSEATSGEVTFEQVKAKIEEINADEKVDGLIVYFPLFGVEKDDQLRQCISPRIDVEGVHLSNLAQTYTKPAAAFTELDFSTSDTVVYPCTPLAVIRVLQSLQEVYSFDNALGSRLEGKTVMVINRSETVGRPLAAMLANEGAKVISVDISSIQIYHRHHAIPHRYCIQHTSEPQSTFLPQCDIIIAAVPNERYRIPTTSLKPGVVCIDLAEKGNFETNVIERASIHAPRIGGVTILMLLFNALVLRGRVPARRTTD